MKDIKIDAKYAQEKWKMTGLLEGLDNRDKATLSVMLEVMTFWMSKFPPQHKELTEIAMPVARRVVDAKFYPEPVTLYQDLCEWFEENRLTYYPTNVTVFNGIDAGFNAVNDYVKVCQERLQKRSIKNE
jgi:hypothetical protein